MQWIINAKERGWGDTLHLMLDMVEPIAPLVSQGLLVGLPVAWLLGNPHSLRELSDLLDDPDGIARLRAQLNAETYG